MIRRASYRALILAAAFLACAASYAFANGEIFVVRVPEEVIGGDDVSVLVSASPRENNIDRSIALEIPESWVLQRAYGIESGAEHASYLLKFGDLQSRFTVPTGRTVVVLADTASDFDPDAAGVAYFFVFSTKSLAGQSTSQAAAVKAMLVERVNPDSPPEIDKKTKKPKERNTAWHIDYPPRIDWTFEGMNAKKLIQNVQILRVAKTSRALVEHPLPQSSAELKIRPEALEQFFSHGFSLQFWFRSTRAGQTILRFVRDDGSVMALETSIFGMLSVSRIRPQRQMVLGTKFIIADGAWHHIVLSQDSDQTVRAFVDAQSPLAVKLPGLFQHISGLSLGEPAARNDFSIDELRWSSKAFRQPTDYERTIATAARDTAQSLTALFHFDEYGNVARSSVPFLYTPPEGKPQFAPAYWLLDSNAELTETSSPVQFDAVLLSADMISPTKVNITWRAASEVGVKQYVLERRVGTYGAFEKVLTVEAKHGVRTPKRGASIIARTSYNVSEDLPKLNGDIELYYRLASVGFTEKEPVTYSEPIKLEYGSDRDVFVEQNDPNPFNPITTIAFRTTKSTAIRLSIFDIIGREVAVLFNGKSDPGRHVYTLDATNWPGGIYFYKVRTPRTTVTRKMVLAK